ncbi:hypothetical protein O1611_g6283 [Lasiodiplodia mahajangana]|uniref:Uncharacterized protein n=1 Tax=Lasiodiplodia mahajangana TaxID=1108764 RepID=A0ACC2JIM8_9PEZI|nr:hypothetical protein O1611_g6283 [Lasiodiplodia mahajangana]
MANSSSPAPSVSEAFHITRRVSSKGPTQKEDTQGLIELVTKVGMKCWRLPDSVRTGIDHFLQTESEEEDDDIDRDNNVARRDMLESMKKDTANVLSQEAYTSFATKHYSSVSHSIHEDQEDGKGVYLEKTLLYLLIDRFGEAGWETMVLLKLILDVAEAMRIPILKATGSGGNTCLHRAIWNDNGLPYVEFICSVLEDKDLQDVIAVENDYGQSCIDFTIAQLFEVSNSPRNRAFKQAWSSKLQILKQLIPKASRETLAKQQTMKTDKEFHRIGNLPLHNLVHIDLCKGLVSMCPIPEPDCPKCRNSKLASISAENRSIYLGIIDAMVDKYPDALRKMNDQKQSPFLYHCYTRSLNDTAQDWDRLEFESICHDPVDPGYQPNRAQPPAEPIPTTKDADHDAEAGDGTKPTREKQDKNPARTHKGPVRGLSKEVAIMVSQKLLELCLAQKTFSEVCDSSFGQKFPSSELAFKAAPLTDKTIVLHKNLPLEPMLACVELNLNDSRATVFSDVMSSLNRKVRETRVQKFFRWLRCERGVKKIVKLVVYDHPQMPCKDEVIKNCLQHFDIRYLDWNKEDLAIDMIHSVAPNLQELWLTWSGRKSTLFGWGNEKHGLRLLKQLGTLYVCISGEWEAQDTNERNFEQFKTDLQEAGNMHSLEVKDGYQIAHGADEQYPRLELHGPKDGDFWIDAITAFRKALMKSIGKSGKQSENKIKSSMNRAVKVAIIDDGVDLADLSTTEYVTEGWYPDRRAPDRGHMNAWYISEKKHGTEMAKLIQLVWPFLNLYVAKLDTKMRVYKSVAASAAEAVEQAIKNGVNVISMSWTIYNSRGRNDDDVTRLMDALRRAEDANIIMFCACQDSGYSGHREPYPATSCNSKTMKRIGSAGAYGERSEYVNPKEVDYLFPGEVAMSQEKVCSGSSAATALAAGLAGLILWCCALQTRGTGDEKPKPTVRTNSTHQDHTPHKTANSKAMMSPETTGPINFQNHDRMYRLFDNLRSSEENPLVNITPLLRNAAKKDDPAKELVRLCAMKSYKYSDKHMPM